MAIDLQRLLLRDQQRRPYLPPFGQDITDPQEAQQMAALPPLEPLPRQRPTAPAPPLAVPTPEELPPIEPLDQGQPQPPPRAMQSNPEPAPVLPPYQRPQMEAWEQQNAGYQQAMQKNPALWKQILAGVAGATRIGRNSGLPSMILGEDKMRRQQAAVEAQRQAAVMEDKQIGADQDVRMAEAKNRVDQQRAEAQIESDRATASLRRKQEEVAGQRKNLHNVGGALYDEDTKQWLTPPKGKSEADVKVAESVNDAGDMTIVFKRPDGTTYNQVYKGVGKTKTQPRPRAPREDSAADRRYADEQRVKTAATGLYRQAGSDVQKAIALANASQDPNVQANLMDIVARLKALGAQRDSPTGKQSDGFAELRKLIGVPATPGGPPPAAPPTPAAPAPTPPRAPTAPRQDPLKIR